MKYSVSKRLILILAATGYFKENFPPRSPSFQELNSNLHDKAIAQVIEIIGLRIINLPFQRLIFTIPMSLRWKISGRF